MITEEEAKELYDYYVKQISNTKNDEAQLNYLTGKRDLLEEHYEV